MGTTQAGMRKWRFNKSARVKRCHRYVFVKRFGEPGDCPYDGWHMDKHTDNHCAHRFSSGAVRCCACGAYEDGFLDTVRKACVKRVV